MRSEEAVNRVEKAIEGPFRGIFWLIILLGAWMTVKDIWYSKWRLGLAYNVSSGKVFVDKAPHDCDFLAAPLGAKYCHYERHVETITEKVCPASYTLASTADGCYDASYPFISKGTTVIPREKVTSVNISWVRKAD